jgi:hypothetical protein
MEHMSLPKQTQQDWSLALQKTKQQRQHALRVPIATRKKQIDDQIIYYKNELEKNITDTNDPAVTENLFNTLIRLRATQTIYTLLSLEEQHGYMDTNTTNQELTKYTKDCVLLAHSLGLSI